MIPTDLMPDWVQANLSRDVAIHGVLKACCRGNEVIISSTGVRCIAILTAGVEFQCCGTDITAAELDPILRAVFCDGGAVGQPI